MENTKKRIIYEAIRLFGERGYDAVSIREIAAAVGIKAGSIYNHFEGKEEILADIIAYYQRMVEKYTPDAETLLHAAQTQPPEEVLRILHYRYEPEDLEIMLHMFRIMFRQQYNNPTVSKYMMNVMLGGAVELMSAVLARLMDLGKIPRSDPQVMATVWINTMTVEAMKASHYVTDAGQFQTVFLDVGSYLIDVFCGKAPGGARDSSPT